MLETIPKNLKYLQRLNLECCGLRDLSALERCPALEKLNLSKNKSMKIETIATNLLNLRVLSLESCQLSDVSVLQNFTALEWLSLTDNPNLLQDSIPI